ncbi:MAG: hypothetical protein RL150_256 [Candidatus Parcubacteria bacterium]|jgi:hypothetical protein
MSDTVTRIGDMNAIRWLLVMRQSDGDIIVRIVQEGEVVGGEDYGNPMVPSAEVEFCLSGGRSKHTRVALLALMEAMERDNQERPIPYD